MIARALAAMTLVFAAATSERMAASRVPAKRL